MAERVLHLCSSLGLFGAEAVILGLSEAMQETPFKPVVGVIRNDFEPHVELAEAADARGIETVVFDCRGRFDRSLGGRIRRFLVERDIAVVHGHGYKSNFYAWLATRRGDARRMTTCHNWIDTDAKVRFYGRVDRLLMKRFDAVVVVSEALERRLAVAGFAAERLHRIDNGIDVDRFAVAADGRGLADELGLDATAPVAAVIGRLSPEKGQDVLLDAAARLADTHPRLQLLLVGEGPSESSLRARARELGLADRVTFAGRREDVERVYDLAEVVVIPSHTEGLPMVLLEAMAAGAPVLATRVGEIPRVLDGGGSLVPPGDAAALSKALAGLLDDRRGRESRAEVARRRVRESFSLEAAVRGYAAVYEQVSRRDSR